MQKLPQAYTNWAEHIVVRPYGNARPEQLSAWVSVEHNWLVVHVTAPALDLVVARAIVFVVDRIVDEFRALKPDAQADAFMDFLDIGEFPPEGRGYMQRKSRTNLGKSGVKVNTTYMGFDVNPMIRMGMSVLTMVLSIATGATVKIIGDRTELLKAFSGHGFVGPTEGSVHAMKVARLCRAVDFETTDPN